MSVEQMITEAILIDRYTGTLKRIASEQDAYARRTNAMNTAGNVLIGAGSAMIGLAVKSVKVAAAYDQQRQAFVTLTGSTERGKKMFDDLARFTVKTPFQLGDWTKAAQTLMATGMAAKDVMPALQGIGNSEAAMGRTGASVQRAAYALGEMNQGFLSMRQIRMLTMDGVPAIALLEKQLHLTGEELSNIGKKHISGSIGVQAILSGIADPSNHLSKGMEGQMKTLPGSITSLKDNWNLFLDQMGEPALKPITNIVNGTSDILSNLQQMSPATQKFVTALAYGSGPVMTVGGGILKAVAAYNQYNAIMKIAKVTGDAERAGEKAKVPIAAAEGAAVQGVTGKYGGLRGMLMNTGTASLGLRAATTGTTGVLAAGVGTVGLYAVALAGLAIDIGLVVKSFQELDNASRSFEASQAAVATARAQGYDLKANAGSAQGYDALPVWRQYGYTLGNTVTFGGLSVATGGAYDEENTGRTALTDPASRALARKHGRPVNGVTATLLRDQAAQRAAAAEMRRQAAREAASQAAAGKDYELPAAMDYKLRQDERRIELLKAMGGHEKELKLARAGEIADLNTSAGLLEKQAGIAKDVKQKYDLMNQAADDRQKAKMLGLEAAKDKGNALDKTITKILGGGGVSAEEVMKRAGVTPSMFANLSHGAAPKNQFSTALKSIATRPMINNIYIGNKHLVSLKVEIKDEIFRDLEKVMAGSTPRAIFGGN